MVVVMACMGGRVDALSSRRRAGRPGWGWRQLAVWYLRTHLSAVGEDESDFEAQFLARDSSNSPLREKYSFEYSWAHIHQLRLSPKARLLRLGRPERGGGLPLHRQHAIRQQWLQSGSLKTAQSTVRQDYTINACVAVVAGRLRPATAQLLP